MIAQVDLTEEVAERNLGEMATAATAGLVLAVAAVVLAMLGGSRAETAQVNGYGLLPALPFIYWIGVATGVLASFVLLRAACRTGSSRYGAAVPTMWLFLLHTAPQLAHAHPRFPSAWTHIGLARTLQGGATPDVGIDPLLAWPALYSMAAASIAQLDGGLLELLLRLWPTWITGTVAALVAALARRSFPTVPLIGSLSALVYVLLAWTGRDHFSPQSVGFLLFVAVLVLLETGRLQTAAAWSGAIPIFHRFSASGGDRPVSKATPTFVALLILCFGAVVSDPLAPLFICGALVLLGLHGRSSAWRLVSLVGAAFVIWFLVAGQPWWSDLSPNVFGPLGGLISDPGQAPANPSAGYRLVSAGRTALGLATFGLVVLVGWLMATERLRHLRPAVPLIPLAFVPFLAVPVVGLGREAVLRMIAYALPSASILIGRMLATFSGRSLPTVGVVLTVALSPVFLLARFGGERYEFTTEADRTAIEAAYAGADGDTLFVADNGFIPWRDEAAGDNSFTTLSVEASETWIEQVEARAAVVGAERIIVVLTDGQLGWRIHGHGESVDSYDEFAQWLLSRPDAELLFGEEGSWAIEL